MRLQTPQLKATVFRDGKVAEYATLDAGMALQHGDPSLIWIEVLNPGDRDFAILQERFELHSLAVKDSMSPAHAPKVDVYEDQIFVVLKVARLKNDQIEYADIDAFVTGRHIITVHHDKDAERVHASEGFLTGARAGRRGTDFILHAVMDFVVGGYLPVVQMIEEEVLAMEQRLVDAFLGRDEVTRLFRLRREAIQLQHTLTRMSDVCGKLVNLNVPCIGPEVKPYFRDVHDQLVRLDGMIGGLVEVIRAVFEASSLLEQQRQGAATRQLAGWAAILGAPTAIAGVYGMSFAAMPGLQSPLGYLVVVGLMAMICLGLYLRFRTLRWL